MCARISTRFSNSGWVIQNYKQLDLSAGRGIAIREVRLKEGRCDYLLLIDRKPVGIRQECDELTAIFVTILKRSKQP